MKSLLASRGMGKSYRALRLLVPPSLFVTLLLAAPAWSAAPGSIFRLDAVTTNHYYWWWPITPNTFYTASADGQVPSALLAKAQEWATYWEQNQVSFTEQQHASDPRLTKWSMAGSPSCIVEDINYIRCTTAMSGVYFNLGQPITSQFNDVIRIQYGIHPPCPQGTVFIGPGPSDCATPEPPPPEQLGASCRAEAISATYGNPCDAATGNKYQVEPDYPGSSADAPFRRYYNSALNKDLGLGFGWTHPFSQRLEITGNVLLARNATGGGEPFTCPATSGACSGNADTRVTLMKDASGYTLSRRTGSSERYSLSGLLQSDTDPEGRVTLYGYNAANQLITVTGPHGQVLSFSYSANHIETVTDPAGAVYRYSYTNENLTQASYPDGTVKRYHYEDPSFPHHLTGLSYVEADGTTTRYSTYAYDANGKAILTEHAGGIERFDLAYDTPTQTTVTDAAGTGEVLTFSENLGIKNLIARVNQVDGKSLDQVFDANNNLTCKKDEEGRVITYTYNATNQKTSMTEGLLGTCAAPLTTSATRTTTYQYLSATLDSPTAIQTPSVQVGSTKTVTLTYGDSRLPTRPTTITQSGFTPTGQPVARTLGLAYNSVGQVTTIDGARTDVNDVTTLTYYECTTAGACGQLKSVTNALGHVTSYDTYDNAGRLTQMTDPNGLRTHYTYDARGRVVTITQTPPSGSARLTQYTYNAAGNLTSVTFPDGIVLTYAYDAAQKLREITDHQGNRVVYAYDLKGNRTEAATYDPANRLVRALAMSHDIRNRVNAVHNGGAISRQLHDAIGNLVRETDAKQVAANSDIHTTHQHDALNRLIETVNHLSGVMTYAYDSADRLREVKAPNHATTHYEYDDLGNLLKEISPDRGTTLYTYDAAGNVRTLTDARGITVSYTYDALNRLTAIDYPADPDVAHTYDTGANCTAGIGRLCQTIDESGTTQYGYDAYGNVTAQHKTELNRTYITRTTYDNADRPLTLTYPDNRLVTYTRDSLGRVQAVQTSVAGSPQALLTARTYRPDGLPVSQTFGNNLTETRDYNLKGELTYQSLGSADTRLYSYDLNGNLTEKQTLPEVASYTYDALDRLSTESASDGSNNTYTYDANGNRLSGLLANGNTQAYAYDPNTNRLTQKGNQALVIDPAGYTTADRNENRQFTWNDAGRLTQVTRQGVLRGTYTYNALSQRTRKVRTTNTGATQTFLYHYDHEGRLIAETRPNGTLVRAYVWIEDEPIAQIQNRPATQTEELIYLHSDHLNTPRLATDNQQTVVWRFESEAFGTGKPDTDPDADETKTNVRLRFPGQYVDGESGLFYNWNRYYDPRIGRYITSDPIGLAGGPNTFTYVRNNPLRWTDPEGLFDPGTTATVTTAVTTAAGVAASAVTAAVGGIAALVYPSAAGPGSDQPPQQCPDDNQCQELYKRIDIAVNGLQRRYRQIRENKGNIDPGTHQDQFKQRQAHLRKLLFEANTRGCLNYRSDAWYWASTPAPKPGPQ